MLDTIQILDEWIILALNGSNSSFWDPVMWWISGKYSWWPFYLALMVFIFWKKRWKEGGMILMLTVLLLVASDQTSVHLFKEVFQRPRPSHNPSIENLLHYVNNYKGGAYGFISSHAVNAFAVAGFLSLVFRLKWLTFVLMFWAALVSYSRIYLGVHYLTDIVAGALWGLILAYGMVKLFIFLRNWLQFQSSSLRS
ncbi:MAG: phosphatase PAP2 family protein [Bacteroidales bacterium]|nr:phosphatase PAP2 family protein [Bacteroidales bacterium]